MTRLSNAACSSLRAHCVAVLIAATVCSLVMTKAAAADFRSVAESAVVLYDAPSARATKLYVASSGYPFEVVVVVEGWSKVRDAQGDLTWVESKFLSERRTVLVRAPLAQVREAADDNAAVVFQAQQNVVLDLLEIAGGWLRVQHRDGTSGFVRIAQVWGA